jgi:hypothetical protein
MATKTRHGAGGQHHGLKMVVLFLSFLIYSCDLSRFYDGDLTVRYLVPQR